MPGKVNSIRRLFLPVCLAAVVLLLNSCEQEKPKERAFTISETRPATALTIGWYYPLHLLNELVGPDYTPLAVKDDTVGSIMLFIVESEEHRLDGQSLGAMRAAHLVVPIEKPDNLTVEDRSSIDAAMVCPLNIIDESMELGDKYHAANFATYSGEITLEVEKPETNYIVTASVKTANGLIRIRGMFDEEEETLESVSAMFSTKSQTNSYFYGEEKTSHIINGKGNLKTEGQNILDAVGLGNRPFFLRFDRNMSWSFDFVQE